MKLSRGLLNEAVKDKVISAQDAVSLATFLKNKSYDHAQFNFPHIIYYLGGLITIGALSLFMNLGWEHFGGWGILVLCVLYAIVGLGLTSVFDRTQRLIPADICATFVICITPLAIYGFQKAMGWWPDESVYRDYHVFIQWHWLFMELGTLIVGIILIWIYRYPFMMMPIAVTLWYMSMDLAAMIGHEEGFFNYELRSLVSMYFGLVMILTAFFIDVRSPPQKDFAFWVYIFGVIAFWCGLSWQHSDSELSKFLYLCINVLLIFIGGLLIRKVFVIFGALGIIIYLGHLAWDVFPDNSFFPVVLTAIGVLIIYLGIWYQRNESYLLPRMQLILPKALRKTIKARE